MPLKGPSALSDAREVARRSLALLVARPVLIGRGALVAITLPFIVLLVGVPLLGHALTASYRMAWRGQLEPSSHAGWGTTLLAGAAFSGYALTTCFASAVVHFPVLAPFYLAATTFTGLLSLVAAAATARGGLAEGIGRVAAAVTSRPLSLALVLSLVIALHSAVSALVLLTPNGGGLTALLVVGCVVVVATSQIVVAPSIYCVVLAPRANELRGPPMGLVAWLLPGPLFLFASAMLMALVVPLAAWIEAPSEVVADARVVEERLVLREESGLAVEDRRHPFDRIVVTTADGGGAGPIDGFRSLGCRDVTVHETTFRGAHAYAIGCETLVTYVDDDGVRLDDGLADRLRARFMGLPALLVVVALAMLAALVVSMRRSAREAALLASRGPEDAAKNETVAVAGKLHLAEGASVTSAPRGRSRVVGAVHFRSDEGALSIVVPEGERAIDRDLDVDVTDGAAAFVVAPASALRAASYREGPGREALILGVGPIERARDAYLTRAGRALGWLGLPAAGLLAMAALLLAIRSL